MNKTTDLDKMHLTAELARIDLLLRRAILLWQRAGQDPNDAFLGLYVSDAQALELLDRPLNGNWGDMARLQPEEEAAFDAALETAEQHIQHILHACGESDHTPRLLLLAQRFGLDPFDLNTLLICLAPMLDLRYEKLYGYLQDDISRKRPSANLALDLLCHDGRSRHQMLERCNDAQPLFSHHLLHRVEEPGRGHPSTLNQALTVDETLFTWLIGRYRPQADLAQTLFLSYPEVTEANQLLAGDFVPVADNMQNPPLTAFSGPNTVAQNAAAELVAAQNSVPLLTIDLEQLIEQGYSPVDAVRLALRDARLTGALAYLRGWDACLEEQASPPALLAALCAHPLPLIVAGRKHWQAHGQRQRLIIWHDFPAPAYPQRLSLWQHFLSNHSDDGLDVRSLAGQFQLTTGQIRDVAQAAADRAGRHGRSLLLDDLFAAARAHSNPKLAALARQITPRYTWEDIVLPRDQLAQLRELVNMVQNRPLVLDEWGLGHKLVSSRGVCALFSGPPGTGKTMAAEVIAGELGLDLYKIDLSSIVSKYIGETEKNLERIFAEAESSNAILFFDEADSLFGKRSEVRDSHDRYANIEISYLLQRMEAYDGVTILATNLRANLDDAFTRRLQFMIGFPFPDRECRQRIWQTLLPPGVPRASDLDLEQLAQQRLAGGNIRNILVSAAYLTAANGQCLSTTILERGLHRELQKMGRLVGEPN